MPRNPRQKLSPEEELARLKAEVEQARAQSEQARLKRDAVLAMSPEERARLGTISLRDCDRRLQLPQAVESTIDAVQSLLERAMTAAGGTSTGNGGATLQTMAAVVTGAIKREEVDEQLKRLAHEIGTGPAELRMAEFMLRHAERIHTMGGLGAKVDGAQSEAGVLMEAFLAYEYGLLDPANARDKERLDLVTDLLEDQNKYARANQTGVAGTLLLVQEYIRRESGNGRLRLMQGNPNDEIVRDHLGESPEGTVLDRLRKRIEEQRDRHRVDRLRGPNQAIVQRLGLQEEIDPSLAARRQRLSIPDPE